MAILKGKSMIVEIKKQIVKCPVFIWRTFAHLFSDKAANEREEKKINEMVKKIVDDGLLVGDRKFIPHGPILSSKPPIKSDPRQN
jgi:hypothetical protein